NFLCFTALQVIGGNATVVQGRVAVLPCTLFDTEETLSQISWQRRTREKIRTDNFYTIQSSTGPRYVNGDDDRFKFIGSFRGWNGTLLLSDVQLKDEGTYTCIFTLFPSGSHKTEIPLTVHVPPLTSLEYNIPTVGNDEVSLATCTAAGSRPPAEVRWITGTLAEELRTTTNSTQHNNGTTTTFSSLVGVPTTRINKQSVQCVITSAALSKEESLPFTIQVHFPPAEVDIVKTSHGLFECKTEANPPANFSWKRSGQSLSQSSVRADGANLHFLKLTSDLSDFYECQASNQYGRKEQKLYFEVVVTQGSFTAVLVLFILLLLLNVAAVGLLFKYGHLQRIMGGIRDSPQRQAPTTSHEPPPTDQEPTEQAPLEVPVGKTSVTGNLLKGIKDMLFLAE
uniref:Poliovirus receptor-related protein 2-like n=1 Tax=Stegastes partitus TaxID=144197 RepID=A0A3B5A3Q0_9TELE